MVSEIRDARAVALGHPVHPMLIVFPVGLFVTAVVFDAIDVFGGSSVFGLVGYWDLTAGPVGAALAAGFGLVDWLRHPPGTPGQRGGAPHRPRNVGGVGPFFLWWGGPARARAPTPAGAR